MTVKEIRNKAEYKAALKRMEELWGASPGSPQGEELNLWAILVEKYEDEHFPILPADPIKAIRFYMKEKGLKQRDVAPFFGGQSKVSEVLSKRRHLTANMMRRLHRELKIPAEVLLA
jgi:HTH-type transcriptional regulator/antitoxin HigA